MRLHRQVAKALRIQGQVVGFRMQLVQVETDKVVDLHRLAAAAVVENGKLKVAVNCSEQG